MIKPVNIPAKCGSKLYTGEIAQQEISHQDAEYSEQAVHISTCSECKYTEFYHVLKRLSDVLIYLIRQTSFTD